MPLSLQAGLTRYFVDGIRPGSFLCAVLENHLADAVARADPSNLVCLPAIVRLPEKRGAVDVVGHA